MHPKQTTFNFLSTKGVWKKKKKKMFLLLLMIKGNL